MNRRQFISAAGVATAASVLRINPAFAGATTDFYVKGLVMASFEDDRMLRLGFPKAPGHKASLTASALNAGTRQLTLKGAGRIEAVTSSSGTRDFRIPELIRMQELYGSGIRSRVEECPIVLSIPYGAIRSITATELSPDRYTFVRGDNGQEIHTFRPRQVAETLKIELLSDGVLKLDGGKTTVALNTMKEIRAEYIPTSAPPANVDAFTAHFPHYLEYIDRPASAHFDAIPQKLGGRPSGTTPRVGHHYAMIWPYVMCFVVGV
jgi:hypothetical protein